MHRLILSGSFSLVNSSIMADDVPAAAAAPAAASATRPEKPDEAAFNQEHAKLEKELAEIKNKTVRRLSLHTTLPTKAPSQQVPNKSKSPSTNKI